MSSGSRTHEVEAPVALEHDAGLASADGRGDHVLHVGDAQAAARDLRPVDLDVEERQARRLLDPHVGGALDPAQDAGDLVRRAQHRVEVVAEDLDRDVAAHAGDQLVEAHLDRLRES